MKNKMLTMAIKPFIPQIKEVAATEVENYCVNYLRRAESMLLDGESYVGIVIVKNQADKTFIVTSTFSSDDRMLRQIDAVSTTDFMNAILSKL